MDGMPSTTPPDGQLWADRRVERLSTGGQHGGRADGRTHLDGRLWT
jgi:hypothetical protein